MFLDDGITYPSSSLSSLSLLDSESEECESLSDSDADDVVEPEDEDEVDGMERPYASVRFSPSCRGAGRIGVASL